MTSNSLQASSHCLQAPFVAGAPGPPGAYRPATYMIKEEDDEELFYSAPGSGEPDDLGDLMQEMREGVAWVEGLTMDCELTPLGGAGGAPSSGTPAPMGQQGHAAQQHEMEQEEPLQPCMAAMLMHPDAARGRCGGGADSRLSGGPLPLAQSGHMIPVALPGVGCEGESETQAPPPRGGAPQPSGWPPLPPFPGAAAAVQQAAVFYGGQALPLPSCPCGSPSLAGFQKPPACLFQLPPPPMPQRMQPGSGHYDSRMMESVPRGGFQMPLPMLMMPHSNSSGDASDGTRLLLRSSFDGSAGDSGSGSRDGCCTRLSSAQRPHVLPHPRVRLHAVPQMGTPTPLAAFDTSVFAPASSGVPALPDLPTSSICDAASESSDVDDGVGSMARQPSAAQVVPDMGSLPLGGPFGGPSMMLPPLSPPGCLLNGSAFAGFPPMPAPSLYYDLDSPAARTARLARQRSLERFRQKKMRRGSGKKIRYQARKVNADRRPRVKGRFVKADEATATDAAATATAAASGAASGSCGELSTSSAFLA